MRIRPVLMIYLCACLFISVSFVITSDVTAARAGQEVRSNYLFPECSVGEVFQQLGLQTGIKFDIYGNDSLLIKRRSFDDATIEEVIQGVLPVGSAIVWEYRYGKLSLVEVSIFDEGGGGGAPGGIGRAAEGGSGGSVGSEGDLASPLPPPPIMYPPSAKAPTFRFRTEVYEGVGALGDREMLPSGGGVEGKGQGAIIPPPIVPIP